MIEPPPLYRYMGDGPGKGGAHIILSSGTREIVTTSIFHCGQDRDGHSWLGAPEDFSREFKRIK
ncbi:MAG: hypothetical protein IT577_23850 [Verrucomicrobiae bacterium]|nr:hypothetical protein [Verrucomicrobiae bacterium]